jgi:hypothetical protein
VTERNVQGSKLKREKKLVMRKTFSCKQYKIPRKEKVRKDGKSDIEGKKIEGRERGR